MAARLGHVLGLLREIETRHKRTAYIGQPIAGGIEFYLRFGARRAWCGGAAQANELPMPLE